MINLSSYPLCKEHHSLLPLSVVGEERIRIFSSGNEVFFNRSRTDPPEKVKHRTGLVVGSGTTRTSKRLLAHNCTRWLVIDVEIPC